MSLNSGFGMSGGAGGGGATPGQLATKLDRPAVPAALALVTLDPAGNPSTATPVDTVADGTVLTLGQTTTNNPPLALTTATVQALESDGTSILVPIVEGGVVSFASVNKAALLALGGGVVTPPSGTDYDETFEGPADLATRGFTVQGTTQVPTITAGNAVGTGAAGSTNPRHVYRTFAADGHWTWYVPAGKILFPVVRFDTDDATFEQSYKFEGNLLRKVTFPGSTTTYANDVAPYPTSGDYTIECVAAGGAMTWYVNGTQAVQVTGAAYTANTKAGMDLRSTDHACSRFTYSAST